MMRNLIQRSFQSRAPPSAVDQPDRLEADHILTLSSGHAGIPIAADALAYDTIQYLLALGTSDGRVKIVGQEGVETCIVSLSSSPTKHLEFLNAYGALLRVNEDGDVQLFSLNQGGLLDSIPTESVEQHVTAAVAVPGEPYVLLGCNDGCIRVAALLDDAGLSTQAASPVASIELRSYTISSEQLAGSGDGAVVAMALQGRGGKQSEQHLLTLREGGSISVWAIRHQQLLAVARDASCPAAAVCCCWMGDSQAHPGPEFATGHVDGSVRLWQLPQMEAKETVAEEEENPNSTPPSAMLIGTLQISSDSQVASPVSRLTYIGASPACDGGALLALGGQPRGKPDSLMLLPLHAQAGDEETGPTELQCFEAVKAFVPLPPRRATSGRADAAAAVLVLSQGGQLMVHDLQSGVAVPFNLPFQICSASGILAVGHQQGSVRVYQFASSPQDVSQAELLKGEAPTFTVTPQPPGWQCVLHSALNATDITALALAPSRGLLAAGDAAGGIVVIDLLQPSALWGRTVVDLSIVGLAMALMKAPPLARRSSFGLGNPSQPRLLLFAVSGEGGVAVMDAHTGDATSRGAVQWVVPKQASEAIGLATLDSTGAPPPPPLASVQLRWACNSNEASPESPLHDATAAGPLSERSERHNVDSPNLEGHDHISHEAAQSAQEQQAGGSHHQPPEMPEGLSPPVSPMQQQSTSPPDHGSSERLTSPVISQHQQQLADGDSLHQQHQQQQQLGLQDRGHDVLPDISSQHSNQKEDVAVRSDELGADNDLQSSASDSGSEADDLLAAAAAAVEERHATAKKERPGKHFMRRKIRSMRAEKAATALKSQMHDAMQQLQPHEASSPPAMAPAPGVHPASDDQLSGSMLNDSPGSSSAASSPPPTLPTLRRSVSRNSASTFSSAHQPTFSARSSFASATTELSAVRYQDVAAVAASAVAGDSTAADPSASAAGAPVAALLLVSTRQFLRLYSPDAIRAGERAPLRKAVMAEGLVHVAAFVTDAGPGVAALTYSGNLLVYALPSLEPLALTPLQRAVGFPFCQDQTVGQVAFSAVCAIARDGHTLLIGPAGETVRLTLDATAQKTPGAEALFDWDVARAAAAAAQASSEQAARGKPAPRDNGISTSPVPHAVAEVKLEAATSKAGDARTLPTKFANRSSLSTFLTSVKDATSKVITETEKGVQGLAKEFEHKVGASFKRQPPQPPSVASVFEGLVPQPSPQGSEGTSGRHSAPPVEEPASCADLPGDSHKTASTSADSHADADTPYYTGSDKSRAALFAGARRVTGAPSGKPVTRSAADIRAAYGRPAQSDIHGQANQNLQALGERGDKLHNLAERTEKMESDAMDFASMAKQIAARERDKKWWQI